MTEPLPSIRGTGQGLPEWRTLLDVNDDEYRRARDEYRHARENGQLALVLIPGRNRGGECCRVVVRPGLGLRQLGDPAARALLGPVAVRPSAWPSASSQCVAGATRNGGDEAGLVSQGTIALPACVRSVRRVASSPATASARR